MDATEILINIRKLVRSINIESKRIQKEYGISIPQLLTLSYLNNSKGFQATHKDIKDFLSLNSSTVTGIINRLEKKGHLARLPKKDDKRVTYIALTSKGAKLLLNTPKLLHEKLELKLESLPEEQAKALKDSLVLLIDMLDIYDIDASPLLVVEDPIDPD